MTITAGVLTPLAWINDRLLRLGRWVGIFAVAIMVAVTLLQVFCRYVLNNALPWPDEAARFCMLWMTGLMAPTAFRNGGFVAIDALALLLPRRLGRVLSLLLLAICLAVLVLAVQIGWKEVTGLSGRFASASLYVPTAWDFSDWMRVPRSWMMGSIFVGFLLLILVTVELILRDLAELFGEGHLAHVGPAATRGAE